MLRTFLLLQKLFSVAYTLASLPRSLWEQGKSKLTINFLTNYKMLTIHFLTNCKIQTETLAVLSKVLGEGEVTNTNTTSPLFL